MVEESKNQQKRDEWKFLHDIEVFVKGRLSAVSHGFDHTKRVYMLAMEIGKAENADLEVLLPATLLHDVGREMEDYIGADHAESSAYVAKDFLKTIEYPEAKINRVFQVIKQHRYSSEETPDSLEAKILSDADKLDALGAIGVARAFTYGGRHERDVEGTIKHFNSKLLKLKDTMYTETAKKIAEERHDYTVKFLEKLENEIEGKDVEGRQKL